MRLTPVAAAVLALAGCSPHPRQPIIIQWCMGLECSNTTEVEQAAPLPAPAASAPGAHQEAPGDANDTP